MPDASKLLSLMGVVALASLAALAGWFVALAIRQWSQRDEHTQNFTVQDLREMRARGEITEREFAAMRRTLLAELGAQLDATGEAEVHESDRETNSGD